MSSGFFFTEWMDRDSPGGSADSEPREGHIARVVSYWSVTRKVISFITLWAPYQADLGTNTEIQYFLPYLPSTSQTNFARFFSPFFCSWNGDKMTKLDKLRYGWTDNLRQAVLKRWWTSLQGESFTVLSMACLFNSIEATFIFITLLRTKYGEKRAQFVWRRRQIRQKY